MRLNGKLKHPQPHASDQYAILGIIKYKTGQTVKDTIYGIKIFNSKDPPGTVIYVHPCGRFYTVEFEFGGRKIRESYTVRTDIYDYLIGGGNNAESAKPVAVNGNKKHKSTPRFR